MPLHSKIDQANNQEIKKDSFYLHFLMFLSSTLIYHFLSFLFLKDASILLLDVLAIAWAVAVVAHGVWVFVFGGAKAGQLASSNRSLANNKRGASRRA